MHVRLSKSEADFINYLRSLPPDQKNAIEDAIISLSQNQEPQDRYETAAKP